MKASRLGKRIEVFEKGVPCEDSYGGEIRMWQSVGEIWCNVEVEEGNEHYENDKVTWTSSYKIECRENTLIDWTTDKVIKYKNQIIFIRGYADKRQQGNRIFIRGIKGNPSDFPVDSNTFNQVGLPIFNQTGNPSFNQLGV